ncbi:MAG: alanine--glyoxylate aminotransferase family protein [Planctomycetes bacterium]|nr:alanine--glyoxylate aminotransferase family protein [Planctomycetota bacterium]
MNEKQDPLVANDSDPVVLLGPGPSTVSPRVLQAMARPLLGYLDADFRKVLDEECQLLRNSYGTANELTFALSGTGMAGMECVLSNLLEPGERLLVGVNGFFGDRICDVAARHGIVVYRVDAPWGEAVDPAVLDAKARESHPHAIAVVHAETSTGCLQPLAPFSQIAKNHNSLFITDCVTSIGGVPIEADLQHIDAAYAGSQKCLGAPPGLSPVTFSKKAVERVRARKQPVTSWYHDISLLEKYYISSPQSYHHTPSNSLHYALLEALRILHHTETAPAVFERHSRNHRALVAGVEALGLKMFVREGLRTPMLNAIAVPDGVDEAKIRARLRNHNKIEIGAGLGKLKGRIIRIGLMGHASRPANVVAVLGALASALTEQNYKCSGGAAVDAAIKAGNY